MKQAGWDGSHFFGHLPFFRFKSISPSFKNLFAILTPIKNKRQAAF
jgi:hypothetical protein